MNREELRRFSEKHAKSKGFKLNPDKKLVDWILDTLLKNEKKFGFRYCPCRAITGDKEIDEKIICPCIFHEDEIRRDGTCHCGLFVK